jgi:glycosyltransferase involved in cell wall biosynthesis
VSTPQPTVTVVIPAHNRADHVGEAIESVLSQTRPADRIVVVDDASTDATPTVLRSFGARITAVRSDVNIERGAARNLGVRHSDTDYVAFLDSDDRWAAGKLGEQLRLAAPRRAVVTPMRQMDGHGDLYGGVLRAAPDAITRLSVENSFPGAGSSLLVSREDFAAAGGFPEQREVQGSEDWVLLLRLRAAGVQIVTTQHPTLHVRIHAANSTGSAETVERCMLSALDVIDQEELVPASARPELHARTRAVLAAMHARDRSWPRAYRHSRAAWATGARRIAAVGSARAALSAARSLYRG